MHCSYRPFHVLAATHTSETMLDLDSLSSSWGSDSVEAPIYASTIKLCVPGSKGEQQPRCRSRPVLACEFEVQTKSH